MSDRSAYFKEYYKRKKEERKAYFKEYYEKNKDKIKTRNNQNYADRLFEAYKYIKKEKLNTYQKFITSDNNIVGLFSYYEITIFDRLKDSEYCELII